MFSKWSNSTTLNGQVAKLENNKPQCVFALRGVCCISKTWWFESIPAHKAKKMISIEALQAVEKGILTDDQLDEAIAHYERLTDDLESHGSLYALVYGHAYRTLTQLLDYKKSRNAENLQKNNP